MCRAGDLTERARTREGPRLNRELDNPLHEDLCIRNMCVFRVFFKLGSHSLRWETRELQFDAHNMSPRWQSVYRTPRSYSPKSTPFEQEKVTNKMRDARLLLPISRSSAPGGSLRRLQLRKPC